MCKKCSHKLSALGRDLENEEFYSSFSNVYNNKPDCCPHCQSKHLIKWGKQKDNLRQRYKCKDCNRVFVSSVGTICYRSRLSNRLIESIAEGLLLGLTIKECASQQNINKNTAWRYRILLLKKINDIYKSPRLSEKVVIDETYYPNWGSGITEGKLRGISHQKCSIAIGVDANNQLSTSLTCCGHPNGKDTLDYWKDNICKGSLVIHDESTAYVFFDCHDGFIDESVNSKGADKEKLDPVNHACSGLQWFLRKHIGIRKAYLPLYLKWYESIKNNHFKTSKGFSKWLLKDLLFAPPTIN